MLKNMLYIPHKFCRTFFLTVIRTMQKFKFLPKKSYESFSGKEFSLKKNLQHF